jgi:NAD-dependent SIR2 family protein deacetylase
MTETTCRTCGQMFGADDDAQADVAGPPVCERCYGAEEPRAAEPDPLFTPAPAQLPGQLNL